MAKENETIADIIAEMRIFKCRNLETGELELCNAIANHLADRLDAAHKREVDALNGQIADLRQQRDLWSKRSAELVEKCNEHYAKLKQVGNAAKLREALVQVQKKIKYLIGNLTVPNSLVASRMEINGIINAALAAPPRNCDVHTADELKAIFKSELVSELPIANEHEKNLVTITAMGVIDTLFATTKKGGNDADK
jgi:hypothetical protein